MSLGEVAGGSLPRRSGVQYCVNCEYLKGIRHRLNLYSKGHSCSLWIASVEEECRPTRAGPKIKKAIRSKEDALAILRKIFEPLTGCASGKPGVLPFERVCQVIQERFGQLPQYARNERGKCSRAIMTICRQTAAGLKLGFGWRNCDLERAMGLKYNTIPFWIEQLRLQIERDDKQQIETLHETCRVLRLAAEMPA